MGKYLIDKEAANYGGVGIVGLRGQSGQIMEEFLSALKWPRAARVYQEMAWTDPTVGAILYLSEMLIRGARWRVEPASNDPGDKEAADFLDSCMNDMDTSWANVITEILSMLTYGFSFHEVVYKIRRGPNTNEKYNSKYSDGKIGWRGIPVRSQASLDKWELDDDNNPVAFVQVAEPKQKKSTIPLEKGLLFRTKVSRNNPEGQSLLRNAYRPYQFKKRLEEIEAIGLERDLAGLPVLKTPENLDLWDKEDPEMVSLLGMAEELVSSVRRDSNEGLILPFGWELSLLSSGGTRQINIGDVIERYDNRIAITLLSDIVLIGSSGKMGSFALADTKQSMMAAALQAQILNIADVFNTKAVPKLFQLNNWQLEKYPEITPGLINEPSLKEVALMLRAMGLDLNKDQELQNYVRRMVTIPEVDDTAWEEIYATQAADPAASGSPSGTAPHQPDDTSQNTLGQSDMAGTQSNVG